MSTAKRTVLSILTSALLGPAAWADSYTIDGRHTLPVFEVNHYGFSTQRGRFTKVAGKLEIDAAAKRASIDVVIDTASVDMGLEAWSQQLRGEHFLRSDLYPQSRFVARDFALDPEKPTPVTGELTLLGVTRPLQFIVHRIQCAKHPVLPRQLCGADVETSFKRSDFGMSYGLPGIGDEIRLIIGIEALKDS